VFCRSASISGISSLQGGPPQASEESADVVSDFDAVKFEGNEELFDPRKEEPGTLFNIVSSRGRALKWPSQWNHAARSSIDPTVCPEESASSGGRRITFFLGVRSKPDTPENPRQNTYDCTQIFGAQYRCF